VATIRSDEARVLANAALPKPTEYCWRPSEADVRCTRGHWPSKGPSTLIGPRSEGAARRIATSFISTTARAATAMAQHEGLQQPREKATAAQIGQRMIFQGIYVKFRTQFLARMIN
jgi:hypothetical protein